MRWGLLFLIIVLALNLAGLGLLYSKIDHLSQSLPLSTLEAAVKNEAEILDALTRLLYLYSQ